MSHQVHRTCKSLLNDWCIKFLLSAGTSICLSPIPGPAASIHPPPHPCRKKKRFSYRLKGKSSNLNKSPFHKYEEYRYCRHICKGSKSHRIFLLLFPLICHCSGLRLSFCSKLALPLTFWFSWRQSSVLFFGRDSTTLTTKLR